MSKFAQRKHRTCYHCRRDYLPAGNRQRYCETCLGPPSVDGHGRRYWPHHFRLQRYGISYPQWVQMVQRYDGKCWICRQNPADSLDHDHNTGQPRGAVCAICNTRLAVVDNGPWLEQASAYLLEAAQQQLPTPTVTDEVLF